MRSSPLSSGSSRNAAGTPFQYSNEKSAGMRGQRSRFHASSNVPASARRGNHALPSGPKPQTIMSRAGSAAMNSATRPICGPRAARLARAGPATDGRARRDCRHARRSAPPRRAPSLRKQTRRSPAVRGSAAPGRAARLRTPATRTGSRSRGPKTCKPVRSAADDLDPHRPGIQRLCFRRARDRVEGHVRARLERREARFFA